MSFAVDKELIGSSEPMMSGDELDVTKGEITKVEESTNADAKTETEVTLMETASGGSGIGLLSKMVFFFVICGAIFAFLKSRKTPGLTEKSLA